MPPRITARDLRDRIVSSAAGIVALSALAVSVYQAYIARQQQKMSAWPYVTQGNTGAGGYGRLVQNLGLGPALVRTMRVLVDGRPTQTWGQVARLVLRTDSTGLRRRLGDGRVVTSSLRRGMVILPGATVELLHADSGVVALTFRDVLNDDRVRIQVCYCSLYQDCWMSDSRESEAAPVGRCPDDPPERAFES